jgi:hypothetical protein
VSDNDKPIEKAVELLVYAPIGLAMFAKDTVPTFMKMFVARGHTEITQRRKTAGTQAGNYKTIGQMAVKYGGPEVKRQAGAAAETVRRKAEETLAAVAAAAVTPEAPTPSARPTPVPSRPVSSAPAATPTVTSTNGETSRTTDPVGTGELPIPGYDLLSATQVIERLEGLARPELLAVKAYELAHRARTTILGKIAQLAP